MRLLVVLTVSALLVAACGTATAPGGASVEGRTFLSTGVTEGGGVRELVPGSRVQLAFADGRVSASAGCNTMGGPYRVVDATLVVQELATTEMGCPGELMEQDTWLGDLLTAEPVVTDDGDRLTLTTGSTVLSLLDREVADPDRPLVGTTWHVDSLISGEAVSSTPAGAEATLVFTEEGVLEVSTGCNTGSASYTATEVSVTIADPTLTAQACDDARGELEEAVLAVLRAEVLRVEITAANLTLTAGDRGLGLRAD